MSNKNIKKINDNIKTKTLRKEASARTRISQNCQWTKNDKTIVINNNNS